MTDTPPRTTHFGFETVDEADKAGRVHGVFASVAARYIISSDVEEPIK
jgi:demethylmenaquinone methyltransferase/2-methoxy-6-polyprenyl-1,4-benzoquinol methylase